MADPKKSTEQLVDYMSKNYDAFPQVSKRPGFVSKFKNKLIEIFYNYTVGQKNYNKSTKDALKFIHKRLNKVEDRVGSEFSPDTALGSRNISEEIHKLNSEVKKLWEFVGPIYTRQNAQMQMLEELTLKEKKYTSGRYFSQFGEDKIILETQKLPKKGYYIDVGAADGITFSNTYMYELLGWDGVCFEPDPRNYELAKLRRDNVLPYAVSNFDGEADFAMSSVSPEWSGLVANTDDEERVKTKVVSLSKYLKEQNVKEIDLLSVDTEGTELDVWDGLRSSKIKPKLVIIEFLTRDNKSNTESNK